MGFLTSVRFFALLLCVSILPISDSKAVCFPGYGCFSRSKPFQGRHAALPAHPDVIQTKFYLYTRRNVKWAEALSLSNRSSITTSNFNATCKTVIIIHGFSHHSQKPWVIKMKEEFLKKDFFNVITVDWRKGAAFLSVFYWKAVANSRLVGAQIAHLVKLLNKLTDVSPRSVHIVGHSLGAHIAGFAGRRLARKNLKLGRITGLDPAKPSFEGAHVAARLDESDAHFVDVIHTNTAPFLLGGMGYTGRLGHVDFYPNGGETQPGCGSIFQSIWKSVILSSVTCNHIRAVDYFTLSIRQKCPFIAFPCSSWEAFTNRTCFDCVAMSDVALMGYDADQSTYREQPMYLNIFSSSPFCAYSYLVTVSFSKSRNKHNCAYIKLVGTKSSTKNEKIKLPEGDGHKRELVTSIADIGKITSIQLFYYGFKSFHVQQIQVKVHHRKELYTACFDETIRNSFWSFWTFSQAKYEKKAFAGPDCAVHVF